MLEHLKEVKRVIVEGKCSHQIIESEAAGKQSPIFRALCETLDIPLQSNEGDEGCNCPTCVNWSSARLFDQAGLILEYQEKLIKASNNWAKTTVKIVRVDKREAVELFRPPTEEDVEKLLASLAATAEIATSSLGDSCERSAIEDEGEFADDSSKLNSGEWPMTLPEMMENAATKKKLRYELAS